jgi:hypothetical protein
MLALELPCNRLGSPVVGDSRFMLQGRLAQTLCLENSVEPTNSMPENSVEPEA